MGLDGLYAATRNTGRNSSVKLFTAIMSMVFMVGFTTLPMTDIFGQCSTATGCSVAVGAAYVVPTPTCSYQSVAAAGYLGPGEYRSFSGFTAGTVYDVSWFTTGTGASGSPYLNNPIGTCGAISQISGSTSYNIGANRPSAWACTGGTWTFTSSVLQYRIAPPTTASVSPASTSICGLTSGSLGGNTPSVGTGTWTQASGPGTSSFSSVNSGSSTVTVSAYGSYTFTWTINNGGCTSAATTTSIVFYQQNTLTTAPTAVCDNSTAGFVSNVASTWSVGAGSITAGVVTNATFTPPNITGSTQNQNVTVTATNGTCSASTTIRVDNQNSISQTGTVPVCDNATLSLTGDITGTVWTSSNTGIATVATPAVNGVVTPVDLAVPNQNTTVTITATNGVCTPVSRTVRIDNQNSISQVAGTYPICETASATTMFNGDVNGVVWTSGTPSVATVATPGLNGVVTPLNVTGTTQNLTTVITATNGVCPAVSRTVRVDNNTTATAGSNLAQCNNGNFSLAANNPTLTVTGSTGLWTCTSNCAGISFSGSTLYNSTVGSVPANTTTGLLWTVTNGSCSNSSAMTIKNDGNPVVSGASTLCDDVTTTYNVSGVPSTTWSIFSGTGTIDGGGLYTPANLAIPTQTTPVVIRATYGTCTTNFNLTVYNKATINPIANQCEGAVVALGSDVNGVTFSGTGVSGGPSYIFTAPTPGGASQNYNITLTNGPAGCGDAATVTVYKTMTITPANPISVCDNLNVPLTSNISVTQWSITSGTGSLSSPTGTNTTYTPVSVSPGLSSTTTITATNVECVVTRTITNQKASTAITSLTPTSTLLECIGSPVTLTANGGTLGYGADYKLYSGSCGGTFVASNGTGIFSVTPSVTTSYYARIEGCNTTACQNASVTANAPLAIIPNSGVKTCVFDGTVSGEKYLVNSSNQALMSINENGYNLGNVTATVTKLSSAPVQAGSIQCDAPLPSVGPVGGDELYLPRSLDVTTANTPGGYVDVAVYFTQAELDSLASATTSASAAYQNCWGTVANNGSNLMLTIKHSSNSYETRTQGGGGLVIAAGPWPNTYKASFQVNQFSSFRLHGNGGVNGANGLPVEMLYFDANAIENSFIRLTFATALEINNNGFEIQRSTDGVSFSNVGWVDGHDNSTIQQNYSFEDYNVVPDVVYYYRLKQIDNDGHFDYSEIATAILGKQLPIVTIGPNPIEKGILFVSMKNLQSNIAKITVTNMLGQVIHTKTQTILTNSESTNVMLDDVSDGYYLVTVNYGISKITKKILVQNK